MDTKILENFEACGYEPGKFDHRAHIEVAWHYLADRPLPAAMEAMIEGLKHLTQKFGAEEKYHETITVAFLLLIHDRRNRMENDHDWARFVDENADLFSSNPLERYYRKETLSSDLAKQAFLMPDRAG